YGMAASAHARAKHGQARAAASGGGRPGTGLPEAWIGLWLFDGRTDDAHGIVAANAGGELRAALANLPIVQQVAQQAGHAPSAIALSGDGAGNPQAHRPPGVIRRIKDDAGHAQL